MDKQLYIHILNVLQQSNAIDNMVDIKPAFEAELDSQDKRKNFKAQLDYLVSEGLIATAGKYEFLGWELLTGLYPLDNKKIEARLTGDWETYLAAKRGSRRNMVAAPAAAQPVQQAKLGLYHAPPTLMSNPGTAPKAPPPPASPGQDKYLKEEDFLPFSSRTNLPGQNAGGAEAAAPNAAPFQPPRIAVKVKRAAPPDDEDAPIITARTSGLRQQPPEPEPAPPEPQPAAKVPPRAAPVTSRVVNLSASAGQVKPAALAGNPVRNSVYTPPPSSSGYSSIRFDTENNPFANLGVISLGKKDDKDKKTNWMPILKWAVVVLVFVAIALAIYVYKKIYS